MAYFIVIGASLIVAAAATLVGAVRYEHSQSAWKRGPTGLASTQPARSVALPESRSIQR